MKMMMKMLCAAFTILQASCFISCVDTVILPDDKTVDEDFWKTKSDVQLVVNAAYGAMLDQDLITRLIIWGDMRSDELTPVTTINRNQALIEDLAEINTANTQYDNQFVTWDRFYAVINNCNIVLERAEAVMSEDPSYTRGDYLADCSQMLALRALCYFYLVRNYRDVPYYSTAYMTSSQDMELPQTAPDSVLRACIADLKQAEPNAIAPSAYSDWRRVGYINRDAIQALLADIYLWLGSVEHSRADLEQAVAYCDKVIDSKKEQHRAIGGYAVDDDSYPLAEGRFMFDQLFIRQNAEESIFELQFNGSSNSNGAVATYYNTYNGTAGNPPYLRAPAMFAYNGDVYKVGTVVRDYRGLMNTFRSSEEKLDVRKMVDNNSWSPQNATGNQQTKSNRSNTNYAQNYIIYRLTDVMLMKAEALVALADSAEDDEQLEAAFNLVEAVNTRALDDATKSSAMKWSTYRGNISKIEMLVLDERLRELAFEGKRWYDLLRFNYRHTEGVDYHATLAAISAAGRPFAENYAEMLALMVRKFETGGNAVSSKMRTEPSLYLPVPKVDIEVNPNLRQNPVYSMDDEYSKNY